MGPPYCTFPVLTPRRPPAESPLGVPGQPPAAAVLSWAGSPSRPSSTSCVALSNCHGRSGLLAPRTAVMTLPKLTI